MSEPSNNRWPPMCVSARECPFSGHHAGRNTTGYGGSSIQYECAAAQLLAELNRTLSALCAILQNGNVPIEVEVERK